MTREEAFESREVRPDDGALLEELFASIDTEFFTPHAMDRAGAERIAANAGRDFYLIVLEGGRAMAYGMLRGWDEGYDVPSIGVAVRDGAGGRGIGGFVMARLHEVARQRGAVQVRLRVHPDNVRARRLYEAMGYAYRGEERGELLMTYALKQAADIVDHAP